MEKMEKEILQEIRTFAKRPGISKKGFFREATGDAFSENSYRTFSLFVQGRVGRLSYDMIRMIVPLMTEYGYQYQEKEKQIKVWATSYTTGSRQEFSLTPAQWKNRFSLYPAWDFDFLNQKSKQ